MVLISLLETLILGVLSVQAAAESKVAAGRSAPLLSELKSDKDATREAAAAELGSMRLVQRDVLEALADALADKQEGVRAAARHALQELALVEGFTRVAAGLTRPPHPIRVTEPQYPKAAFVAKIRGTVRVEFLIARDGTVTRTRVIKSVPGLDDAAEATVRTWLFAPALRDGLTTMTVAQAPVTFWIE